MHFHGMSVVSCKLVARYHEMTLMGEYLPLSTLDHLPNLEELLNRFPGRDRIILGDLNAGIGRLRNPREKQVAYFLASFGMVDLLYRF